MNNEIRNRESFRSQRTGVSIVFLFVTVLLISMIFAGPATADVSVSIFPENSCAELNQNFTVYVYVDSIGSAFNGYDAVIQFDPAILEFVSVQEESVMVNGAGSRWWVPEVFTDHVHISHALMQGGAEVTGPGALSSITFSAPSTPDVTDIIFDSIEFYWGPYLVDNVGSHDGVVYINEDCSLSACCLTDGSCQLSTEGDCLTVGGDWLASFFICDPNPCPPLQPQAVCCVEEVCSILTAEDCATASGIWHSEWTTCDPNPCIFSATDDEINPSQTGFNLIQPNPFVGTTELLYSIATAGPLRIELFDPSGRCIKKLYQGFAQPGQSSVKWNGTNQAGQPVQSGAYFCRLTHKRFSVTQSLIILE